jgi:hypothetical protein
MNGATLLEELAHRIGKRSGSNIFTTTALAQALGMDQAHLAYYKNKKNLTPRQVVSLMEKYANRTRDDLLEKAVVPIVEFFQLDPVKPTRGDKRQLFSQRGDSNGQPHPYLSGLRERLKKARGIYIFHDSRGSAIYAGKAVLLSLWTEMNNAFNRDRGEVQNIKRVRHPTIGVQYKNPDERQRNIVREAVALHHIASYMSAYEIPTALIGKFEALIVRAFANDLLNVRMERF